MKAEMKNRKLVLTISFRDIKASINAQCLTSKNKEIYLHILNREAEKALASLLDDISRELVSFAGKYSKLKNT